MSGNVLARLEAQPEAQAAATPDALAAPPLEGGVEPSGEAEEAGFAASALFALASAPAVPKRRRAGEGGAPAVKRPRAEAPARNPKATAQPRCVPGSIDVCVRRL